MMGLLPPHAWSSRQVFLMPWMHSKHTKRLHMPKSTILTKPLHIPLRRGQMRVRHITKTLVSSATRWEWVRPCDRTRRQSLFAWSNVHKHFCRVPVRMYTHHMLSSWQHMQTDTLEEWMNLQSRSQRGSEEPSGNRMMRTRLKAA